MTTSSIRPHSLNRSFGVIAGAPVSGAEEKLRIGLNDGGGHYFESYWLKGCDWLIEAGVGAQSCICRSVEERLADQQPDHDTCRRRTSDHGCQTKHATRPYGRDIEAHRAHG